MRNEVRKFEAVVRGFRRTSDQPLSVQSGTQNTVHTGTKGDVKDTEAVNNEIKNIYNEMKNEVKNVNMEIMFCKIMECMMEPVNADITICMEECNRGREGVHLTLPESFVSKIENMLMNVNWSRI